MPDGIGSPEVQRLEDRIDGVNREAQLRLDVAMARIEGLIARIMEQNSSMRETIAAQRAESRVQFQWIIGGVLAVGLGLGGLLVGVKQVWTAGVQSGQSLQSDKSPAAH
jgi:hypothetical protein